MEKDKEKQAGRGDSSFMMTRRTFLHKTVAAGVAVGAASVGWFPTINTMDIALGAETFKFAWISDTHLYPKDVNTRFVEKAVRAAKEVQAMSPPADFLIFGGDLSQLGERVELELGRDILSEITAKKYFIPGEHDWYLDMGETWRKFFGETPWYFDHKGVRFIGLNTVAWAPDYWTERKLTPKERMAAMATLDSIITGPWAAVEKEQRQWLNDKALFGISKETPIVLFTHTPLYEYYPPWNFWTRDWKEVLEILKPFKNVTNIHGHTHQVLYNEIGNMRSIGMLATSWPWPYAPTGVPPLTKPMIRVDPGDPFDGVGWSKLTVTDMQRVENEYVMWRKQVFAESPSDRGDADNINQRLTPRIVEF